VPIVFAPPQPVAPQISAAAGAAEQFNRFAPVLQRQQEAAAAAYAQSYATAARMAEGQADRSQRGAEFAATAEARGQALALDAGQQAAQMQFRAQLAQQQQAGEGEQLRERYRLMQETQAAELTHREKVEYNRLQMAAGAIRDNPDLDAAAKNDLLTQIHARVSPLQDRMARTRMQQEQLENQRLQQQLAQQDIIAKDRAAFMAGNLQAVTRDVRDEAGNVVGTMMMIPGEKPHWIDRKQTEEVAAARREREEERRFVAEQRKLEQVRLVEDGAAKQWNEAHKRAMDMANKELDARIKAAGGEDGVITGNRGVLEFDYEKRVGELLTKSFGMKPTLDEQVAHATRALRPQQPAGTSNVGPEPAGPKGAPDNKPLSAPDATPTESQAAALGTFAKLRGAFAAVPRDQGRAHPEQAEAVKAVGAAEALYRKWGDPLNMPEADRRRYLDLLETAGKLTKKFQSRTTAPARAEPAAFDPFATPPNSNAFLPGG
jgi:hypothetical protein